MSTVADCIETTDRTYEAQHMTFVDPSAAFAQALRMAPESDAGSHMYMYSVLRPDRQATLYHAFKHAATRRYVRVYIGRARP